MNTMEDQDDDQSSTHSFSVVHRNPHEKPDEASLKSSTLEEPPVEEIAKVAYLDFSIGIYQNIHVPGSGPRRFYHDPVVIIDPKSVKSESNELCFKVKMGDPEIRALVLARLLSLKNFSEVDIQLNDISTVPYEEIRLLVKPGSILKSTKQIADESIPYYIQLRDSLDFILQFEYPKVAEELVKDFKQNPEIVTKKWMLDLECKGLALGTGCKSLEMMSVPKRRPTWNFPVSTLPFDFDQEARAQNIEGELKEQLERVQGITEIRLSERDSAAREREEAMASQIKDLEKELQTMKSATRDRFEGMRKKFQALTSDYQCDVSSKQTHQGQQILEKEEGMDGRVKTNRKLSITIPIFAVRKCTNPGTSSTMCAYASHDFEMETEHAQIELPTGIVTIQTSGIWQFNFNGNCNNLTSYRVELRVNGVVKALSNYSTKSNYATAGVKYDLPVDISALLKLDADQKVGIFVVTGRLYEDGDEVTTRFSGTLYYTDK